MTFGERLKELRREKRLTQIQFAEAFQISNGTIGMWETNKRQPDQSTLVKLATFFGVTTDYLLGREEKKLINNEVELNDLYPVPLLGKVVAGVPIESQENLEGYIYISYKPKENYFALRVQGDSMINAGIRDKSILVVHKQTYAENGEIVVAMLNGESTVKRFKIFGNDIFLMPENPAFEPIHVQKNDDFLILGKVIEVRIVL